MLKSSFGLLLNPSISRSFDSNNLSFLLRIAKGSKSFSLGLFNIRTIDFERVEKSAIYTKWVK